MAVQHGQQHGQAIAFQAHAEAARAGTAAESTRPEFLTSMGRVPSQ